MFRNLISKQNNDLQLFNKIKVTTNNKCNIYTSSSDFDIDQADRLKRREKMKKMLDDEHMTKRQAFLEREKHWESLVDLKLLREEDLFINKLHREAVARGHFTYDDPDTGYRVLTRYRHFLKGTCCGNACRHCVYEHENVPEELKRRRVYNSAFWVDMSERPDLCKYENDARRVPGSIEVRKLLDGIDPEEDPLLFKH